MAASALSSNVTHWVESRKKGVFTAQMDWTLQVTISSTAADMAPSVIAGLFTGLPVEGTSYSTYNVSWPLVTCRGVTCEKDEGGIYFYKTEWSDENAKDEEKATDTDPLNDLPIIKPIGGTRERAITRDRNDEIILNAAGDPIAQTIEDNIIGLSVTANVAIDSGIEQAVLSLRNRTNNARIQVGNWTIDVDMARVMFGSGFLSEVKRRNDTEYFELNYELIIDERDRHRGTPLNAGFRQKVEVDPIGFPGVYQIKTILADDGSEPSEPVPLNHDGTKMDNPQPDTVIYLDVEKYQQGDFTQLPGITAWTP
jgi:hypothetical protein